MASRHLEVGLSVEVCCEDGGLPVGGGRREEEEVARKLVVVFDAKNVADLNLIKMATFHHLVLRGTTTLSIKGLFSTLSNISPKLIGPICKIRKQ